MASQPSTAVPPMRAEASTVLQISSPLVAICWLSMRLMPVPSRRTRIPRSRSFGASNSFALLRNCGICACSSGISFCNTGTTISTSAVMARKNNTTTISTASGRGR
ncbi:hypothetical protein D3C72_1761700 [compost metagenome]